ncbi:hypothetical protein NBH00_07630 [Paraconexibacter antarcticus]|uniref:Lipoprotein n=1 Tax=Paraconexibacter antarcticus TaxID=2949664 RepID=A0ABY5DVP3_9ACTN|nr:hypothetical protein [Paraconexibacter antarcticus]UTI66065.1 hypothetical protein NBH00_07630 [Paraconexibacter antarcticus]
MRRRQGARGAGVSLLATVLLAVPAGALVTAPARAHDPAPPPPAPAPAPPPPPAPVAAQAVDRTYRGSHVRVTIRGDDIALDASGATGALGWRLRLPGAVRVTIACSGDIVDLDLGGLAAGDPRQYDEVVSPDPATETVHVPAPGAAGLVAAGANGCRAVVSEPLGYVLDDVVVGFDPETRKALYRRSLDSLDRNRQALAADEAALTSALTWFVSHRNDLRAWGPTADGRVPGEAVLRLRLVTSLRAVALRPAYDDLVYLLVPPDGRRSRSKLTLVAKSTSIGAKLVVLGRDLFGGRQRYWLYDSHGREQTYAGEKPPYPACSDPVQPSRCSVDQGPGRRLG